jgi:phosphomannomutase
MEKSTCFKAYDIRGKLGDELNKRIAYRIGLAMGQYLQATTIVVGGDVRETSEELKLSLAEGLMGTGVNVLDFGITGTEEIYYATKTMRVEGGVEVTASHNPTDYNGMKLVCEHCKPINGDTGLLEIQKLAEQNQFLPVANKGRYKKVSYLDQYTDHLLTYITPAYIKPLKLVVKSGNGAAGHVIDALEAKIGKLNVPIEFIKVHHEPDCTFPNGIPNPLLIKNRKDNSDAVVKYGADM